MEQENYFKILNTVDLNDKKEKKGSLTYVSWAYAWGELKKRFPDATYKVYERDQTIKTIEEIDVPRQEANIANVTPERFAEKQTIVKETTIPINYFTDGKTCWVKVSVTVEGIEHIEELPIMDNKNQSINSAAITSTQVNKSIQRALTKAIARHGLGLYIYANEDLPDGTSNEDEEIAATNVIDKDELFNKTRDNVVALIKKAMGQPCEAEINNKISGMFKGKRISQTTIEDLDTLLAAEKYLQGIVK